MKIEIGTLNAERVEVIVNRGEAKEPKSPRPADRDGGQR